MHRATEKFIREDQPNAGELVVVIVFTIGYRIGTCLMSSYLIQFWQQALVGCCPTSFQGISMTSSFIRGTRFRDPCTFLSIALAFFVLALNASSAWADIIVYVRPNSSAPGQITLSQTLRNSDGSLVKYLDDLPAGVRNSPWAKQTIGRTHLHLVFYPGHYVLTRPWVWSPAESGRVDSQLYLQAMSPRKTVIKGSSTFAVPKTVHLGQTEISVNRTGSAAFEQLWVNGTRATRARTPNVGSFYYMNNGATAWNGMSTLQDGSLASFNAFESEPDVIAKLSGLSGEEKGKAVLVVAQPWSTGHHRIAEWDGRNVIRVSPRARWPFMDSSSGSAQRYFIENIPSALDAPSEWYVDAAGQLRYRLTDADKQTDLTFETPVVDNLVVLSGNAATNNWVDYINFEGIVFQHARANLPSAGFVDNQAAVRPTIPSALQFDGARHIRVNNCEISRIGGYAVWMRNDVTDSSIENSEIYDAGAGGVKIGQDPDAAGLNSTGNNAVRNNKIHGIGHQFAGAVGVWVGKSSGNQIEDNLIGDTTYSGISVGWAWNFDPSTASNNLIRRNFLYNVMQGLSDGAGIYTLGRSPGTVITGNVVKNSWGFSSYGAGAWGLYSDEGSSDIMLRSNVVYNTRSGGYHLQYGTNLTLESNVFAAGGLQDVMVNRSKAQATLNNNVIFPAVPAFIGYREGPAQVTYLGNRIATQFTAQLDLSKCGGGCQVDNSLSIAPGSLLDTPLVSGSAAVSFPDVVASSWTGRALAATTSPATIWQTVDSTVPRRKLNFDASDEGSYPLGSTPAFLHVIGRYVGEVSPTVHRELVSIGSDNQGARCLAFIDSASMSQVWEPYAYVATNYDSGTTQVAFRIKADATTNFLHEWRDSTGNDYKPGAAVSFVSSSAGLTVSAGSQIVATMAIGQWVDVQVASKQGVNPTWSLRVKGLSWTNTPIEVTKSFNFTSPNWTTKALYFISNANASSNTCLDKVSASNVP